MRIRQVDNTIERRIITGMIMSTEYLKGVQPIYQPDLMHIPFARTVADWCLDYFTQYGIAPQRDIQPIYEHYTRGKSVVQEQADMIGDFLTGLSDEYEHAPQFNADYLLDQTEKRFKSRSLQLLAEDISAVLSKNDPASAERLLDEYKRIARPTSAGVNPLTDEDLIRKAFDDTEGAILFKLPSALGRLIGNVEREDLIGIMGPEKRGKTWWLIELAMRALNAKCNVAFFGAGDMMEKQYVRRLHTYNTRKSHKHYGRMKSPIVDCIHNQEDTCDKRERQNRGGSIMEDVHRPGRAPVRQRLSLEDAPQHNPCTHCIKEAPRDFKGTVWHEWFDVQELNVDDAIEAGARTVERSRKRFKLSCHPTSSLTIREADAILDRWEQEEGFVPDVIIYDYFDIMAPENPKIIEERQKQNETWKAGRSQAQRRHAAVITVTQTDAQAYDQRSLSEKNFSEDKRKYGHATKFITLNQTPEEKSDGVMRIGIMFVRDDAFDINKQVTVLQNLNIGRPFLGAF